MFIRCVFFKEYIITMAKKKKKQFDIYDANANALISFWLMVIACILIYVVFFYLKLIPGK